MAEDMDAPHSILPPQPASGPRLVGTPTAEEWEHHRATISRLYFVDKEPLKNVRAIMAEQHGFHAT